MSSHLARFAHHGRKYRQLLQCRQFHAPIVAAAREIVRALRRSEGKLRFVSRLHCAPLSVMLLGLAVCGSGCTTVRSILRSDEPPVYVSGAVAADHQVASEAGVEILRRGGNAVDAAVATSFCLSVVRPYSCGIGGGGFMIIYMPATETSEARAVAINYRETCPAAVGPDYFVKREDRRASRFGHHAVAVPGTVAGLAYALQRYGTMSLSDVLQPAIRAAEDGVPADEDFVRAAQELGRELKRHPSLMNVAGPIWHDLCAGGAVQVGDIIRQPHQARALRAIAAQGPDAFYRGEIGHAIFAAMHTMGGPMTMTDLRDYTVREMEPLRGQFRDYEVLTMPPPSSGGIAMQQILALLERRLGSRETYPNARYYHVLIEAMKHAFADRSRWLADAEFHPVPVDQLLDRANLDRMAASIVIDETQQQDRYGTPNIQMDTASDLPADGGTSHFCVIDSTGMAVACTETINLNFGSLVTVPGYGIVLNNQMDDFTTVPGEPNAFGLMQSDRNSPQPGKRPLSSMSPTILVKDGKAALIAGASGGPRIITGTTQGILNSVLFEMTPQQAVHEKRLHHQWMPATLQSEAGAMDERTRTELRRKGHEMSVIDEVGQVQMIRVDADGIRAASDPRKGGRPAGY